MPLESRANRETLNRNAPYSGEILADAIDMTTLDSYDANDESEEVSEEKNTATAGEAPSIYKYVPLNAPLRRHAFDENNDTRDDGAVYIDLAVVGEASVGKTKILERFAKRQFSDTRVSTVGVDLIKLWIKSNAPKYDRKTHLQLIDTAGQEHYMTVVPQRLRSAYGVFMIFDATKRSTFDALGRWSETISRQNQHCCRMLVANKMDLYRKLPQEQRWMDGVDWAAESDRLLCDDGFFCVSAATGEGIDSMVVEMVDSAIDVQKQEVDEARRTDAAGSTTGIVNITFLNKNKNTCQC